MSQADGSASRQDFREFFETAYQEEADAFRERYRGDGNPGEAVIEVDWTALNSFDPNLADAVLKYPKQSVMTDYASETPSTAMQGLEMLHDRKYKHGRVRVSNLPESSTYRVGELRTRHLGKLIAIEGEVAGTEAVEPLLVTGFFICQRCGAGTVISQGYGKILEPHQCESCERQGPFALDEDHAETSMVDFQTVFLMPRDTNLDDPPIVPVYLKTDLCDRVGKGDHVTVVGMYDTMPLDLQKEVQMNVYMEANEVDQDEKTIADKLEASELQNQVRELVGEKQQAGDFSVDKDEVVDEFAEQGVREQEVRDAIDALLDDHVLAEVDGSLILE